MEVGRYRKKPIEVDAVLFDGTRGASEALAVWAGGRSDREPWGPAWLVYLETLEGTMVAQPGDYIIREPFPTSDRRFYPCKPNIFEATYDLI